MIPKIEYGQKDIREGHVCELGDWLVHCTYASPQVLRFKLFHDADEMELQKILMPKMRQPWRLLKANIIFSGDEAGKKLNAIFYMLDDYIKPKNRYDRSAKD